MNIDQFMAFRDVAQAGSISKAALKTHVSASSLSRTVKALENELGTELFDRNGRHLMLNQFGQIALHHADVMNEELENAVNDIQSAKNRAGRLLRIYFRHSLGSTGAAMASFIRMHPEAQLDIILSKNEALTEGYDLQFASDVHEFEEDEANILLGEEGYCMVVPNDHWSVNGSAKALSEFRNETFIMPPGDGGNFVFRTCRGAGFKPKHIIECPQVWTSVRMASQGLGVLIAPELSMLAGIKQDFAQVPLKDNIGKRYLHIAFTKGYEPDALAYELVEYMQNYFVSMKDKLYR
jgi:LysR family transcriptional regulator, transcription activator of glutamate synthase operon